MDGFELPLLVYEYKCNGHNLVPNGLSILDEEALVIILSMSKLLNAGSGLAYRIARRRHPHGQEVDRARKDDCRHLQGGLMTCSEKQAASKSKKKKKSAEAKEEVLWKEFLGHSFEDHSYEEMVRWLISEIPVVTSIPLARC